MNSRMASKLWQCYYQPVALKIYFLRHGQTAFSRANSFCGSGLDPEITTEGAQMAEAFGAAYANTEWAGVYTSSLKRTISTAQPLCQSRGITSEQRDDLKEIGYGAWEGKSVEWVDEHYHDDYIRWTADPAWHAPTGGESAVVIAHRTLRVIDEIRQKHDNGNVLMVSHKATIRIAICSLLGIDVGRFRYRLACPVGSVSVVEFTGHGTLLNMLADRSHMDQRLRDLPGT